MKILVATLAACTAFGQSRHAGSLTTWTTQIVPLVIVGEGWSQKIVLMNVDTRLQTAGTIRFLTKDGAPWSVNLRDRGRASSYDFTLTLGQATTFETIVENSPQQLGWAIIKLSSDGIGDYFGQTIFRKQTPGYADFLCSQILGSQASYKASIPFDNTEGKFTRMGILTPDLCTFGCSTRQQLRVTARDFSGSLIFQRTISQRPDVLYWMNLETDFPETRGRIGILSVEPVASFSIQVSLFSLQFGANGAFTAITPFED